VLAWLGKTVRGDGGAAERALERPDSTRKRPLVRDDETNKSHEASTRRRKRVAISLADSGRPGEGVARKHIALVLTPQYALHCDLPNHGGLGNPLTNEEVTMATAKKKAPAKKAAKKKGKKK
jgi:hypothetical protein